MMLPPPDPVPIVGQPSVIDGDTLEIHGQRIRLWGIDAPESRQTCLGRSGDRFRCGQLAALRLQEMTIGRTATCTPHGRPDRYRRVVAVCTVGGADVAAAMVRAGMAVDYPRYSRRAYASQQAVAKSEEIGLWWGTFQMPWLWRANH